MKSESSNTSTQEVRTEKLMRLFEIDYQCGFCQHWHTAETYHAARGQNGPQDLDELHAATMKVLKDEGGALEVMKGHAVVLHQERGDMEQMARAAREHTAQGGVVTFGRIAIVMTGEDRFLCDECHREFSTHEKRWMHMGRHPQNGHRLGRYACEPQTTLR